MKVRKSILRSISVLMILAILTQSHTVEAKRKSLYNKTSHKYLSRIIEHEAGHVKKHTAYMVGVVVIKRVKSPLFPNTVKGVLLQDGPQQYMSDYHFSQVTPSKRSKRLSKKLLKGGFKGVSKYPDNLLYHANFKQGSVYDYSDGVYFCLHNS